MLKIPADKIVNIIGYGYGNVQCVTPITLRKDVVFNVFVCKFFTFIRKS